MFLDLDDKIIFYFDITPLARDKDVRGEGQETVPRRTDQNYIKKQAPAPKKNRMRNVFNIFIVMLTGDIGIETPDETAEDRPLREKPDQGQLHDPQPRHDLQLQSSPADVLVFYCYYYCEYK
jgi:hypothetical protein